MALFRNKSTMPTKEAALPGRSTPLKVAETHFVNGHRGCAAIPAGMREAVFGLGCFWGAERIFWQLAACTRPRWLRGWLHSPSHLRGGLQRRDRHAEVVRVIYDPQKIDYQDLLEAFWESHDPTQGMRQETTSAPNTARRSTRRTRSSSSPRKRRSARTRRASRPQGGAQSPPRFVTRRSFSTQRTITSSIWRRTRMATAASEDAGSPMSAAVQRGPDTMQLTGLEASAHTMRPPIIAGIACFSC